MANILSLPGELLVMITMEHVFPASAALDLAKDDIMTPASHWAPNAHRTMQAELERRKALYNMVRISRRFYFLLAQALY
jgi:hypothetical protein